MYDAGGNIMNDLGYIIIDSQGIKLWHLSGSLKKERKQMKQVMSFIISIFQKIKKIYTDDAEISKIYKNSCIRYDTFGF